MRPISLRVKKFMSSRNKEKRSLQKEQSTNMQRKPICVTEFSLDRPVGHIVLYSDFIEIHCYLARQNIVVTWSEPE